MKSVLFIQSSPRESESYSQRVAHSIVHDITRRYPHATVKVRDLGVNPPPHVGQAFIGGLAAVAQQRTPQQAEAMVLSDNLIEELASADLLVLAVPMHNFGIPSTLKAWIDHVVRAGATPSPIRPTAHRDSLKAKRAIVVLASGGVYSVGPMKAYDFQEPYLRAVLGFIGITNVNMVRVEGVGISAIGAEKAIGAAMEQSRDLLAQVA